MKKMTISGILIGMGIAATVFGMPRTYAATQTCVDGMDRSNVTARLTDRGTVTVGTVDNKPLCEDLTLNLSSYSLPDNYNGQGFKNNPTAIPQSQFANTVVTIGKGTTKAVTVTVPTPEACKPTQIDLYYGQNQTEIRTSEGLVGTDAIVGKIFDGTGSCVTTTTQTTPPPTVTETSAPAPEPVKTTLPETGSASMTIGVAAALLAAGSYGVVRLLRR